MRIALVAVVGAGLAGASLPGAAPGAVAHAAVLIEAAPAAPAPDSARCPSAAPACDAAPGKLDENLPPAAVAGIAGFLALALAFRPRKPARKMGLPEVTS
jgi:hypothetical protein